MEPRTKTVRATDLTVGTVIWRSNYRDFAVLERVTDDRLHFRTQGGHRYTEARGDTVYRVPLRQPKVTI